MSYILTILLVTYTTTGVGALTLLKKTATGETQCMGINPLPIQHGSHAATSMGESTQPDYSHLDYKIDFVNDGLKWISGEDKTIMALPPYTGLQHGLAKIVWASSPTELPFHKGVMVNFHCQGLCTIRIGEASIWVTDGSWHFSQKGRDLLVGKSFTTNSLVVQSDGEMDLNGEKMSVNDTVFQLELMSSELITFTHSETLQFLVHENGGADILKLELGRRVDCITLEYFSFVDIKITAGAFEFSPPKSSIWSQMDVKIDNETEILVSIASDGKRNPDFGVSLFFKECHQTALRAAQGLPTSCVDQQMISNTSLLMADSACMSLGFGPDCLQCFEDWILCTQTNCFTCRGEPFPTWGIWILSLAGLITFVSLAIILTILLLRKSKLCEENAQQGWSELIENE